MIALWFGHERSEAAQIRDLLPPLIRVVEVAGMPVAWVCDPMHGNSFEAPSGRKTRRFDDVLAEVHGFFDRAARRSRAGDRGPTPVWL